MNERDNIFRKRLMDIIKSHGKNSDKVLTAIRVRWNRSGSNLVVNGFAFEYEDKPKK